jgi:glycine/D-amino acid oxidase-like deaminating enzyme
LLVDIPALDISYIYHQQLRLVPAHEGLFWCGSNYRWDYNDLLPDQLWRQYATAVLNKWLRLPYTIIDHIVAERPTTAGQAPVVMLHPEIPSVAMLNGLGTRGFSMGPLLAKQMAKMLLDI